MSLSLSHGQGYSSVSRQIAIDPTSGWTHFYRRNGSVTSTTMP
jgi:hypothetical protein